MTETCCGVVNGQQCKNTPTNGSRVCEAHRVSAADIRAATAEGGRLYSRDSSMRPMGEAELYKARQEMLAQQITAKPAYEAKAMAVPLASQGVHVGLYAPDTCGTHAVSEGVEVQGGGIVASPAYSAQVAAFTAQGRVDGAGVMASTQARTFTREEVLTVLKAQMAMAPESSNDVFVLRNLIRIFERME